MKKYSLIEKLIIIAFDVSSFLTFCFFASLLKGLLIGTFLFVLFAVINSLIPEDKRIHADRLLHCFILSIFFLLSCIVIYKFALNYMSNTDSIILSTLLVILANFSTTNFLWWKRNELNERVYEWVKYNLNNKELLNYKEQLYEKDGKKYHIFQYYFEENKSQNLIAKLMGIDVQRVGEEISMMSHHIEFGIRLNNSKKSKKR